MARVKNKSFITYPRRPILRWILRRAIFVVLRFSCKFKVEGVENIPKTGPVIITANHFHFTDAPLMIAGSPRLQEFIGGADRIHGPKWTEIFPWLYGIIYAFRGGNTRSTIELARSVLEQDGVMGVFIEGGSWAQVLRPARPGTTMLAHLTGAPIVPLSIVNATSMFKTKKPEVKLVYHPPIYPPKIEQTGRERRRALDAFGDQVMEVIASELPDSQKGRFSPCPEAREAALAVSDFPFNEPQYRGK